MWFCVVNESVVSVFTTECLSVICYLKFELSIQYRDLPENAAERREDAVFKIMDSYVRFPKTETETEQTGLRTFP